MTPETESNSTIMGEKIEEVEVDAVPSQFWGAIRIFTEKPHVINRRICGTVNIWIGVCGNMNFSREKLVESITEAIECDFQENNEHERNSDNFSDAKTGCEELNKGRFLDADMEQTLFSSIQKKLEDNHFKSLASCGSDKVQDGSEVLQNNAESKAATEAQWQDVSHRREGKLSIPWEHLTKTSSAVAVIRKILPKQVDKLAALLEVILLDGERSTATYVTERPSTRPSINPKVNYSISLTSTGICISSLQAGTKQKGEPSLAWLKQSVLPKVVKWTSEVSVDGLVDDRGSLKLIDVREYNAVYQGLKMKYGKPLVEMWPEVTDPLKFVYEDISIAAYLILLWRQERQQKGLSSLQSFVDLGCGNGLLVFILSGEGHQGLGIDVKKRKIWDLFPGHVKLQEGVIEPSDKNLFPEHDWLIGNHSDELTPWIPVIAAKSSYTSRFFVIPCCAHDFSQKYRRRHAGRSQYSDYLEYIKEIGAVCGFEVKQDKLRIPSTKRICLVGSEKTADESEYCKVSETIDNFIKERTETLKELPDGGDVKSHFECPGGSEQKALSSSSMWTENFKAREGVQPVRNCTQLKRSIREDIISAIATTLMEKKHLVEVDTGNETWVTWNRGGSMTLGDLAKRLDPHLLAAMKKECGGLQTLLKNHRYIFSITKGQVSLQVPQPAWKKATSSFTKTKLCWFHTHHGSSCPLPSEMCTFAHGEDDMRCKSDS